MKIKSLALIKTNRYLKKPEECDAWLNRSVISSSAIEGVHIAARRALGIDRKTRITLHKQPASKSS
jgi:hypothetical protein